MNTYEMAKAESERLMRDSFLIALSVVAILGKKEDEISYNKACKEYKRDWIDDRTNRGMLDYFLTSGKTHTQRVYSRCQIEHLKQAEKNITNQILGAQARAKEITDKLNQL